MKIIFALVFVFSSMLLVGQDTSKVVPKIVPKVQDLDFLIGTWEITFQFYDTYNPEKGVVFTETGTKVCEYDLELNGVPRFITCNCELTSSTGRKRKIRESIRYGRFTNSFERAGLFSNWPATSREILYFDSTKAKITIYGELNVQNGIVERYEDVYLFDEKYSSYKRKNVANFSDMPVTVYNLTMTGTGRKIK